MDSQSRGHIGREGRGWQSDLLLRVQQARRQAQVVQGKTGDLPRLQDPLHHQATGALNGGVQDKADHP